MRWGEASSSPYNPEVEEADDVVKMECGHALLHPGGVVQPETCLQLETRIDT